MQNRELIEMAWDPLGHFLPGCMFLLLSIGLHFSLFSGKANRMVTIGIILLVGVGLSFEFYWERWRLGSVLFHQHESMYFFFFLYGLARYFSEQYQIVKGRSLFLHRFQTEAFQ